nr:MAG TPA_asm: hypothetical protein [Caudoviricetes sp.]
MRKYLILEQSFILDIKIKISLNLIYMELLLV